MRTNIVLDDELVAAAFKYAKVRTKRELVNLALREFVQRNKRKDVLDLVGNVEIDPEYDHKALRENGDR